MLRAIRDVSLDRKLPLLISLLLLIVIAALASSAVREARRTALLAARTRLESVTTQFATSSADQYRRRVAALAAVGHNEAVVRFAQERSPALRAGVARLLAPLAADTPATIGVEIRDAAGQQLLAVGNGALMERLGPGPSVSRDSAAVGPIVARGDTFAFSTAAPIGGAGRRHGHLVQWRRITLSPQARAGINEFIGHGASVYFGSPASGVWVDLGGSRAEPPPLPDPGGGFVEFERPGHGMQLALVRPIAATPWMIEVDFPRAAVLSQADTILERIGVVSLLALVLGVLAVWLLSRTITRPLRELTAAAEAIAAGDFSRTVHEASRDEVGRLARAFRTMAGKVQTTQEGLEGQVSSRTGELRAALKTLEETQDELVRKERIAVLGQLSSSVGHELRNPLGVMSNAVYYLQTVLADAPATVKEYLGILRNQIGVSEKIVSDLLDFARMRKPDRRSVPLASLVAEQLAGQPAPPNVTVETAIEAGLPVFADPVHVGQILGNLTANAYQAMEKTGGTLTIRAGPDGPGQVTIEVADTGPGIALENLERIFEPLFTTRTRGIGLGLALSRSLATTNGGSLTARTREGGGAMFSLVLPAALEGGTGGGE